MVGRLKTQQHRLLTRRCLSCGFDGTCIRTRQVDACPSCGCDLNERPPRSYAEMEGLLGQPLTLDAPMTTEVRESRVIQRWLAFLFVAAVGLLAIVALSAAAVP